MPHITANDRVKLFYQDVGSNGSPPLILLHGFTGSSEVFRRNIPALSKVYHIIAPDLRGHGKSDKPKSGYHVSRLAMDLKNMIDDLKLPNGQIRVVAGSLGCAIIWSYAELFTSSTFSHVVFVDQSPLQSYASDWNYEFGNKGCNSAATLADLLATFKYAPADVYRSTINSCLGYLSHPLDGDDVSEATAKADMEFFETIASQGVPEWYGKLMADHTALDWRDSIRHNFACDCLREEEDSSAADSCCGSFPKVLVVASSRSGCFPSAGPLAVVELINGEKDKATNHPQKASGVTVDWGGHWCYWEDPKNFNAIVLDFLK